MQFDPEVYRGPGFYLRVGARLHDQSGYMNGDIADSGQCYWGLDWTVGFDDSLKNTAYVVTDSVQFSAPGSPDTLVCNVPQELSLPDRWSVGWPCPDITFELFHQPVFELKMVAWLMYRDGRPSRRFDVAWQGRLKKRYVYSDY